MLLCATLSSPRSHSNFPIRQSIASPAMTLDVLHFILPKGGNPDEIRESQRKRGLPEEIVDEIAQMYADWVKRTQRCAFHRSPLVPHLCTTTVDYEASNLAKSVNQVQKEIAAKKKARRFSSHRI